VSKAEAEGANSVESQPWVKINCPDCGIVRVRTGDVTVRHCWDDQSWSYRTRCPECEVVFVRSTSETLADVVLDRGAELETWTLPAELQERPDGPPLQLADLLELHLALIEPDWFDDLASITSPID
jgi:hypothetical protein